MIVDYIRSNRPDVAENRFGMFECEIKQKTTFVSTEFEIRLLNEIIHQLARQSTPLMRGVDDRKGDCPMEARDKLLPSSAVIRFSAGTNQLFCRHGRMACQRTPTAEFHKFYMKVWLLKRQGTEKRTLSVDSVYFE